MPGGRTLKYTLCGDYVYACGKRRREHFSFDMPFAPPARRGRLFCAAGSDLNKSIRRVTPSRGRGGGRRGQQFAQLLFTTAVLSLNMYRFAPRACSPNSVAALSCLVDNRTARTITKNICFKDCTPRDKYIAPPIVFS